MERENEGDVEEAEEEVEKKAGEEEEEMRDSRLVELIVMERGTSSSLVCVVEVDGGVREMKEEERANEDITLSCRVKECDEDEMRIGSIRVPNARFAEVTCEQMRVPARREISEQVIAVSTSALRVEDVEVMGVLVVEERNATEESVSVVDGPEDTRRDAPSQTDAASIRGILNSISVSVTERVLTITPFFSSLSVFKASGAISTAVEVAVSDPFTAFPITNGVSKDCVVVVWVVVSGAIVIGAVMVRGVSRQKDVILPRTESECVSVLHGRSSHPHVRISAPADEVCIQMVSFASPPSSVCCDTVIASIGE